MFCFNFESYSLCVIYSNYASGVPLHYLCTARFNHDVNKVKPIRKIRIASSEKLSSNVDNFTLWVHEKYPLSIYKIKNTILSLNASQAPAIFSRSWTIFNGFANVVPTIKNSVKETPKNYKLCLYCDLRIWGKYLITSSKWFRVYKNQHSSSIFS